MPITNNNRPQFIPPKIQNYFKRKLIAIKQRGTPVENRRDSGSRGRSASSIHLLKGDLSNGTINSNRADRKTS